MRMTAADQLELGIIDEVIAEPGEGAHTDPAATTAAVKSALGRHLADLERLSSSELLTARYARLRGIGTVIEAPAAEAGPVAAPTLGRRLGRLFGRDEPGDVWGDRYRGTAEEDEPVEEEDR